MTRQTFWHRIKYWVERSEALMCRSFATVCLIHGAGLCAVQMLGGTVVLCLRSKYTFMLLTLLGGHSQ